MTRHDYQQYGQYKLAKKLEKKLQSKGKRTYIIPVGGSNYIGTWGYVAAMAELADAEHKYYDELDKLHQHVKFDDIVLVGLFKCSVSSLVNHLNWLVV